MNTVPITIQVPTGGYCATFDQDRSLLNECPLLKSCEFETEDQSEVDGHYCPLVTGIIGLNEDRYGVHKWNSEEFKCPSLIK